jgi:hypothetical protein
VPERPPFHYRAPLSLTYVFFSYAGLRKRNHRLTSQYLRVRVSQSKAYDEQIEFAGSPTGRVEVLAFAETV